MGNFSEVTFPGLGWTFNIPSEAFHIGNFSVKWYGIIIAFGFTLAVIYGGMKAYKWKMSIDGMLDVLIYGTIFGIVGARLYYVAFEWSSYKDNLLDIFKTWEGGIAIYGGIIGAILGAYIACRKSKINFRNLLDLGALGLLIGQGIGRWGNFMNQEAFGANTDTALFRMISPKITHTLMAEQATLMEKGMTVDPFSPVHPTFLYESIWCLVGFLILHYICTYHRKFKGEIFMLYGVWYGLERMVVEGLRTDSLYIPGTPIRVSQALSALIVAVAAIALIVDFVRLKKGTLPKSAILTADDLAAIAGKHGKRARAALLVAEAVENDKKVETVQEAKIEFEEMKTLDEVQSVDFENSCEGVEPDDSFTIPTDADIAPTEAVNMGDEPEEIPLVFEEDKQKNE